MVEAAAADHEVDMAGDLSFGLDGVKPGLDQRRMGTTADGIQRSNSADWAFVTTHLLKVPISMACTGIIKTPKAERRATSCPAGILEPKFEILAEGVRGTWDEGRKGMTSIDAARQFSIYAAASQANPILSYISISIPRIHTHVLCTMISPGTKPSMPMGWHEA